jgi:hypothetical protein
MPSAVIIVDVTEGGKGTDRYTKFLTVISPNNNDPGVHRILENIWQIDLEKSPGALGRIVYACENEKYPYGILQFDGAPQWLPASFDPRTNPGT